jgi:hypothetical protein
MCSARISLASASTTLLLSHFDFFEPEHPLHVVRLRHEEVGGEHFLNHGTHAWQRQTRLTTASAFALEETVDDRGQDDVSLPPRQAAPFEVVEPDLVCEFLVLLLDGPSLIFAQGRASLTETSV